MPVINRDSNNDNNNNDRNLTDIRTEFEALKIFRMKELCHLRQKVKKLCIEEVNSRKEKYNDILSAH